MNVDFTRGGIETSKSGGLRERVRVSVCEIFLIGAFKPSYMYLAMGAKDEVNARVQQPKAA